MNEPNLVPIYSLRELYVGMAVLEKWCDECLKDHWLVLMRPDPQPSRCPNHKTCPPAACWVVAGCAGDEVCVEAARAEGRLFRLPETRDINKITVGRERLVVTSEGMFLETR